MAESASAKPPPAATTTVLDDAEVAAAVVRFSAGEVETRFAEQIADRRVEFDAIRELLMLGVTPSVDASTAQVVADAMAAGCLGERHLWRDLGLPSRAVLRRLFERFFEPFSAGNVMDMRWKKYVYRKLCRWGGFHTCKAPSCSACSSYAECFGPEV